MNYCDIFIRCSRNQISQEYIFVSIIPLNNAVCKTADFGRMDEMIWIVEYYNIIRDFLNEREHF